MNEAVIIEYLGDIPAEVPYREYLAGERYAVTDVEAAARVHPNAVILKYEDGRPYKGPGSLAMHNETGKTAAAAAVGKKKGDDAETEESATAGAEEASEEATPARGVRGNSGVRTLSR